MSLAYLANRFLYRIVAFLRHWYVDGFLWVSSKALGILEALDRRLALKITLRYFFKPLYQDYTPVGYLLGVFFRFWRIIFASIIYAIILVIGIAVYITWGLVPLAVLIASRFS